MGHPDNGPFPTRLEFITDRCLPEAGVAFVSPGDRQQSSRIDLQDFAPSSNSEPSCVHRQRDRHAPPGWRSSFHATDAHNDASVHHCINSLGVLSAAHAFYAGVLGFALVERTETHLALDTGAFRLWINRATDGAIPFIPSLDVVSATEAREILVRAGCAITRDAADGMGFDARDPFGCVIEVIERGKDA